MNRLRPTRSRRTRAASRWASAVRGATASLCAVLAAWAVAVCISGCDAPEPGDGTLSPEVATWLERVGDAHRRLDQARDARAVADAARRLTAIIDEPAPMGLAPEHWQEVRQDVAGRLSRVALERGDTAAALLWASRGLSFHDEPSVFRANLFIARAQAERAVGDADAASASLFEALKVNQKLLEHELENP